MRGGPRGFRPGFPCPAVLRYSSRKAAQFRLRGSYPLRRDVPVTSTTTQLCNFPTRRQTDPDKPYNPHTTTTAVYHVAWVWADPFSLATTQGVSVDFFSSGYLDVSVRPVHLCRLCIQRQITPHYRCWVYPFGDPRVKGCSAPHRGLSQPSTSFFDSWCQGIHRKLLLS